MSLYDMFGKEFIQLKARPNPNMCHYHVRASVPYDDGIYLAPDGIVIIKNKRFKCTLKLNQIYDKWGSHIDLSKLLEERNPIYRAVKEMEAKYRKRGIKKRNIKRVKRKKK